MRAQGKTIVITGGGNGIGRQIVLNLLGRGARVAAVDLSQQGLAETARLAAAGDRLSTHVVNITDRAAVEALPAAVAEAHGNVDGLINCAGIIQRFVLFKDLEYADIEKVMNVNFWGVINMTKAFLPGLLGRPEAHVVNVSSMGSYVPVPGQTIYGASKAAVKLLTEGLYAECVGTSVRVTCVFPGAIHTDISKNSGVEATGSAQSAETSKIKMTEPDAAAAMIVDAMERDAYHATIGPDATFLYRYSRLSPKGATNLIQKQMADLLK